MTTVSTYEPCLTYEVPFDETTGDKYKLTVESVDPDEAKQTRSMRKFTGNTIEELLYTREVFLNDTGAVPGLRGPKSDIVLSSVRVRN